MQEESEFVEESDMWDLVVLIDKIKPISCKWVYMTKRDSKGTVKRFTMDFRLLKDSLKVKGLIWMKPSSMVSNKNSFRIMALLLTSI